VKPGGEGRPLAAFLIGSVLAGGNAVGVRYSNRELDPLWGAGLRFALAAALLAALMAVLGRRRPAERRLRARSSTARSTSVQRSGSPTTDSFAFTPASARQSWRWYRS
jgi:hypothetical protein